MTITDYPHISIICPECNGRAHKVVEERNGIEQEGYECEDCGAVTPP
jgi:uncharacterized Zn finger protein